MQIYIKWLQIDQIWNEHAAGGMSSSNFGQTAAIFSLFASVELLITPPFEKYSKLTYSYSKLTNPTFVSLNRRMTSFEMRN